MLLRIFLATLGLSAVLSCPHTLSAATITVDFEGVLDGTILATQYPGLTFSGATVLTAGISLNEFDFPPHSGTNVAIDSGGPITIHFATPISSFGAYFTYLERLTLTASPPNPLLPPAAAIVSKYSNNTVSGGFPGSSPNEFVQVSGVISTVTILGDMEGGSFAMDDVTYATMPTGVPEPGTILLAGLGLFSIVVVRAHRSWRNKSHILLLLLALCCLLISPTFGAGPVQSITAVPSAIAANAPTTVTISAAIGDQNLIPGSMTLLQLSSTGAPAVLGVLHDDGQDGDQIAGDQVYTLRINMNGPPGTIGLQVSVAIRGQIRRALSDTLNITVTQAPANLPPDPGDAGMATLAGIDSDNDGVRDDVQRYIALANPTSAKTRAVLTQISKVMRSLVADSNDRQASISHMIDFSHALECSAYINGGTLPDNVSDLSVQFANTQARSDAYKTAQQHFGGHLYKFGSPAQQRAFCAIDPTFLTN